MGDVKCFTRGGTPWSPQYLERIDPEKCIGCGRCHKVCGHDVMELVEKPFEGEDEFGDDMGNKVMSVVRPDSCIGCAACLRICTKRCHEHVPA
jgi:Nif-specific ferredoxin III